MRCWPCLLSAQQSPTEPAAGASSPPESPRQVPELAPGPEAGRAAGPFSASGQSGSGLWRLRAGLCHWFQQDTHSHSPLMIKPGGSDRKESACNEGDLGLIPGLGKIPWRRAWPPSPVFLPGESHGQRSLAGYSPRGHKESDTTEQLSTAQHLMNEPGVLGNQTRGPNLSPDGGLFPMWL